MTRHGGVYGQQNEFQRCKLSIYLNSHIFERAHALLGVLIKTDYTFYRMDATWT